MARKQGSTKLQSLKYLNEIRELLELGASERQIINHYNGKLDRAQVYRYIQKVLNEIVKRWERESVGNTKQQYALFKKALEDSARVTKQIMENSKIGAIARTLAADKHIVYRAQLLRLAEKGPSFLLQVEEQQLEKEKQKALPINGKELPEQ